MQNRNYSGGQARTVAAHDSIDIKWRYFLVVLVSGAVIAAGFFFAARQHFAAIEYSMKNNQLRLQVESLEAEKRRLMLAREVTLSPREIRKATKMLAGRRSTSTPGVPSAQKVSAKLSSKAEAPVAQHAVAKVPTVRPDVQTAKPTSQPKKARSGETAGYSKERFELTAVAKLR